MDSVDVALTMPDRQLEGLQQMDDDEDADQETAVNVFNLETVADTIFKRKKKSVGEFDEDADDEEDNPLAVLEVELDEENEVNSENMEDWLKKLHIRTQHLVGKVTVNGMSRLAATNNVATALTRFKGKVRVDNSGKRAESDGNSNGDNNTAEEGQSTSESPETPTTPTEISKDVTENPSKENTAVRSKKDVKPSSKTEPKTSRRKETSPTSSGTKASAASSEIRKTARTTTHHPPAAGLPVPARTVVSSKTNKVKAVKSVRSGMKSKVH